MSELGTSLPVGLRARLAALVSRLRGGELSRARACTSIAVGLFIGCLPVYGLHFVLCVAVCVPLRLDLLVAYLAANISNPLIAPFLVTAEVETGAWLLTGRPVGFDIERARAHGVLGFFVEAAVGALVVGTGVSALGALITSWVVKKPPAERARAHALSRTVARYRGAPPGDRIYVWMKLRLDPLTRQLSELGSDLGDVLDLGCGRAQFALFLRELGSARSVRGLDWDTRKIAVARHAAGEDARFSVGELSAQLDEPVDTVLLFDVLHYLSVAEQDALLARLCRELPAQARILIRELDERPSARSRVTQWFERMATRSGYNRASSLHFRPAVELVHALEKHGCECSLSRSGGAGGLSNVLIVARAQCGVRPCSAARSELDFDPVVAQ